MKERRLEFAVQAPDSSDRKCVFNTALPDFACAPKATTAGREREACHPPAHRAMAAFGHHAPVANPNPGDIEVANAATDGISCVTWSPTANFLAVGSWDHQIRVWDVQTSSGQAVPKAATSHDGPVLCAAWSSDGARVFTGSCDKTAKVWDLASSSHTQVAAHDAPIKNIFWVSEINMIVTSSWDKTIKYWDGRSGAAVATLQLPERPYCMDIRYPLSAPCEARSRAGPTPATHELPVSSTARLPPPPPTPTAAHRCWLPRLAQW